MTADEFKTRYSEIATNLSESLDTHDEVILKKAYKDLLNLDAVEGEI